MKRAEVAALLYHCLHVAVHKLAAYDFAAAVEHAVTHSLYVLEGGEHSVFLVEHCLEHCFDGHGVVRNRHFALISLLSGSLMPDKAAIHAYPFHETLCKQVINLVILHVQQLILQ